MTNPLRPFPSGRTYNSHSMNRFLLLALGGLTRAGYLISERLAGPVRFPPGDPDGDALRSGWEIGLHE
jgi:hypothetical protein